MNLRSNSLSFQFSSCELAGVIRITSRTLRDDRGNFSETYKASAFSAAGISDRFVQDNQSVSALGVVRGLHFQVKPYAQGKLVRVVSGVAWDVAVDIRNSSPTFGQWAGFELSAESGEMLWIPPGFAHGFVALTEDTRLVYKCTAEYAPEAERGIRYDDPDIGIAWPLESSNGATLEYHLSQKDSELPLLRDVEVFP